jgi:hypothetical protein
VAAKNQKPQAPDEASEAVRAFLIKGLKSLTLIIPLIILGYVLYMVFVGSDPRNQLKTVDETLIAYTSFVRPYTAGSGGRPNATVVRDWLTFFDRRSRDFFEENIDLIVFSRHQFEVDRFRNMSPAARREEAMRILLSRPPLNGFGAIRGQRSINATETAVEVAGTAGEQRVVLRKEGEIWFITELGGLMLPLREELEVLRPALQEALKR